MQQQLCDVSTSAVSGVGQQWLFFTQVLKQLTNSNKAASTLADVEDQLAALAAAAPEWITLETDLVGKRIVRLQRKVNNKQIRLRLMSMSGSRRSSGAGLI